MKKQWICVGLGLTILALAACGGGEPPPSQTPPPVVETPTSMDTQFMEGYQEEWEDYAYEGETSLEVEGRSFTLEDDPENLAEGLVADYYRCDIAGTGQSDLVGEGSGLFDDAQSLEMRVEEGYMQELTVHELSTLTWAEIVENEPTFALLHWMPSDLEKGKLVEFAMVRAKISWVWTPEALARGPQLGDNEVYDRGLLCGRREEGDWKVWEMYWLDW